MSFVRHTQRAIAKRYVSSDATKCHGSLPPAKMRALISLYHQTQTFITPDNLSERIDAALTDNELTNMYNNPTTRLEDLRNMVRDRRVLERFTEPEDAYTMPEMRFGTMGPAWEETKALRERRVVQALYGADAYGTPGLEVLEESAERIQQSLAEDLEQLAGKSFES